MMFVNTCRIATTQRKIGRIYKIICTEMFPEKNIIGKVFEQYIRGRSF